MSLVLLVVGLAGRAAMAQAKKVPPAAAKAAATPAGPRPYLEHTVEDLKSLEQVINDNVRRVIMQILRAGTFKPGQQAILDRYYKNHAFARWSVLANRTNLPEFRKELSRNLRTTGTGDRPRVVHDHLNALTLGYMADLAKGHYHPATRFNAMLMIGELNSVESVRDADIPVPLPEALPLLMRTAEDPGQIDALKVAALIGIKRHVTLGDVRKPELRQQVFMAMCKVVGSRSAPNRSVDGHAWMRTLAIEVLGELKLMGNNGVVPRKFAEIVAESNVPFSTRCAAARALGEFDYRGASGLNPSQVAAPLGQLVVDACEAEGTLISHRRLKSRLVSAWVGLTGTDENHNGVGHLATKPPHKKFVDALRETLKTMLDLFDDRGINIDELSGEIENNKEKLQQVLDNKPK